MDMSKTTVYLPRDLPAPSDERHTVAMLKSVVPLLEMTGGGAAQRIQIAPVRAHGIVRVVRAGDPEQEGGQEAEPRAGNAHGGHPSGGFSEERSQDNRTARSGVRPPSGSGDRGEVVDGAAAVRELGRTAGASPFMTLAAQLRELEVRAPRGACLSDRGTSRGRRRGDHRRQRLGSRREPLRGRGPAEPLRPGGRARGARRARSSRGLGSPAAAGSGRRPPPWARRPAAGRANRASGSELSASKPPIPTRSGPRPARGAARHRTPAAWENSSRPPAP